MGSAGTDRFCFELEGSEAEGYGGIVHSMRASRKYGELPITAVALEGNSLRLVMGGTGVVLTGVVDLPGRLIRGRLTYPAGGGVAMDLRWVDPDTVAGLRARPAPGVGAAVYRYERPRETADGWVVGSSEEGDLPAEAVVALAKDVIAGRAGVLHSLLIVRHGRLVVEEYFHGYGPGDLHPVASVTKSVASLLVGAAVADGLIPGLDVGLSRFFPEDVGLFHGGMQKQTLRTLLTMTMGLEWRPGEAESTHGTGPAFFRSVLSRDVVAEPGTRWRYVSAEADLLAGILRQSTGVHADAFAEMRLFEPIGITTYDWAEGKVDGYPQVDGTLQLLPRDMARIGQLVLTGGRWNGMSVIPPQWIAEATSAVVGTGDPLLDGYGYLWWTGTLHTADGPTRLLLANGWGSQFIAVLPDLDTVIVTTGGNQDNGKHFAIAELLEKHLLGAP